MVGLQVTVLMDLWVIRHQMARDTPRWALFWAGLPRRIHCDPLLLHYDRRQRRPRPRRPLGAVRAAPGSLRLADRRPARPRAAFPRAVWPTGGNILDHGQHHGQRQHRLRACRNIRRPLLSMLAPSWALAVVACRSNLGLGHPTPALASRECLMVATRLLECVQTAALRLRSRRVQMGCCTSNISSRSSTLCMWHVPLALETCSQALCLWLVAQALALATSWVRARPLETCSCALCLWLVTQALALAASWAHERPLETCGCALCLWLVARALASAGSWARSRQSDWA